MSDDLRIASTKDFRSLVQQRFASPFASLVLEAQGCAAERFGAAAAAQRRGADILLLQHGDPIVVTAALLVPPRRHGVITASEVRSLFGDQVADLVEEAVPQRHLTVSPDVPPEESLRSFLKSIAQDVRLVVLHLGLRLAELETLVKQDGSDPRALAQETLNLHVPLADRLGLGVLRIHLEDVSFRLLEPEVYEELARQLEPIRAEDEVCLGILKEGIQHLLKRQGLRATIEARTKGLYSLYSKMYRQERPIHEIMDKIGLRIIVSSVEECYTALDLLHTHFRPIPGTFDDHIARPKENGYQSLHTCVYPVPGISHKPVEIQIRTEAMHREAQFGVAAHWRYKSEKEAALDNEAQLRWLRKLLAQHEKEFDHAEFLEHLRRTVLRDDPLASQSERQARMPQATTVQDSGLLAVGPGEDAPTAKINGITEPATHCLQDEEALDVTDKEQG